MALLTAGLCRESKKILSNCDFRLSSLALPGNVVCLSQKQIMRSSVDVALSVTHAEVPVKVYARYTGYFIYVNNKISNQSIT